MLAVNGAVMDGLWEGWCGVMWGVEGKGWRW